MVNLGPLSDDADERAKIKALLPEDREWLAEHGWQEPAPYPEIGTERLRGLS